MMVPPPPPRGMQVVPTNPPPSTGSGDRVTRHFAAIEAALAAGDDARARQELQLATQAAPGHPRLGEMGAKISQARTARELARSIGEARARLAAGALTEAGQWLARAQKVAPHAPEVAELRTEIERAADGREQERDRQRRVAAALAHAREALKGGALDTAQRGVTEALGLDPHDADALALKADIEAARGSAASEGPNAGAGAGTGPATGSGSRGVGPPPPASARQLTGGQNAPVGESRSAAATPPPPASLSSGPPELPLQAPWQASAQTPGEGGVPARRSAKLPLAFLGIAAVVAILFGFAALFIWRQVSARFLGPRTVQEASATPGTPGATDPPATTDPPPTASNERPAPTEPAPPPSTAATEPPVAPPTTPHGEDAAQTARLVQAVTDFQGERTASALNTLASLIDEAPQRDDLRQTAEQWARTLQARAGEARATARKPASLPPVMRMADGHVLRGEAELGAGDPIAAARAFERGRDAWAAIVARQASRGTEAPPEAAPVEPARTATREPAPREPAAPEAGTREPATREPERRETESTSRDVQAMTPEQEFERANIMRLLQSVKRAFDSRSGESLRPLWPTLSASAAQGYQSQWQRMLTQQWTYNSVHIRMAADGRRAAVDTEVTVTSLTPGARENSVERRRVTFNLERLGPLWVVSSISGL
jgi:hypothetical protein